PHRARSNPPSAQALMASETAPSNNRLFGDGLRLREEKQVVRAACLGIGARHIEAPEWVHTNQRASALAVDIEIAGEELTLGLRDASAVAREERTGQPVLGVVGDGERVIVVFRADKRQHWAEDFLLGNARCRRDIGDDRGRDEIALAVDPFTAERYFPLT